jgi:hypothetical protein
MIFRNSRYFVKVVIGMIFAFLWSFSLSPAKVYAQDDGPRAYWVNPVGTNEVGAYARWLNGNQISGAGNIYLPDVVFAATAAALDYTRSFGLFNRSATANVNMFFANVSAADEDGDLHYVRGISDFSWQVTLNIMGGSALDEEQFESYKQRSVLSFLLASTIPTGSYEAARKINIGENRWSFRVGIPFVQSIGPWIPGKITTLEITPSVNLYSTNQDFEGGQKLEQAPIFSLEAHITRDITEAFYISLDYSLNLGGETSLDGEKQDDSQSSQFFGVSLGFLINGDFEMLFRYYFSINPVSIQTVRRDQLQLDFTYTW